MNLLLLSLIICALMINCIGSLLETIEFDLGKSVGLSKDVVITSDIIQSLISGIKNKDKNKIYYYGLLKLYGISLTKDPQIAMEYIKEAAELGHIEAMTAIAVSYMYGNGVEINYNEAAHWLKKSISLGDINAHWLYAILLLEGKVVTTNTNEVYNEIYSLLAIAVSHNIPQAQHFFALIHEYGLGTAQDFHKAIEYYTHASEQNYVESIYNLGLMYTYGRGTVQDFNRAISLFELGSRFNHGPSIYYMGLFKFNGYGCHIDYNQAVNWLELAASYDDKRISNQAKELANQINQLLIQAHEVNTAILRKYQMMEQI